MAADSHQMRNRQITALLWLWIGIALIAYLYQFRDLIARLFTLLSAA